MKNKWTTENISDQSGKICIVTGANSGLGFETAKALAGKGAEVLMAVRDIEKGQKAKELILKSHPNSLIHIMELNLSDLKSVSVFAEAFMKKFDKLDLLINNAGVMIPPYSKTKDGFETQIGTNHMGHFALTSHLFPILKKTVDSRIVNVSSIAHKQGKINFEDINSEIKYSKLKAYGQSKLANLLFTYELDRKLKNSGLNIKSVAAHPGWTNTNLSRHIGFSDFISPLFAQKQSMGALPTIYAAVAEDVNSGDFYGPGGWKEIKGYPKKVSSNEESHNLQTASKLWSISEEMTKIKFEI